jgi:cysteinyl-tRNA synthetase
MPLKIYNTMTRQLEEFQPLNAPKVTIYACGPTVYNYFHIGNGRAFLVYDMFRRYLEYKGYLVTFVQNLTDIEDKIINRAHEEGVTPDAISKKYSRAFYEDSAALGIMHADIHPRATDHIPEMLDLIQKLIAKGRAYESEGDVYYAVRAFDGYGKLSHRKLDEMKAGARINVDEKKKDPMDFALWKKAKPGEPFWESPWGPGRPGWHIECSAMSIRYLGETFDIHCGGEDLVFPHHENEIAQAEGATDKPFAKYWLHVAFLRMNGEKMSKSLGNFITVRDALKLYSAEAIRYFMLSSHYRSPLDFSDESLKEANAALQRAYNCLENIKLKLASESVAEGDVPLLKDYVEKFEAAMDEDFNASQAMAVLFELVGALNQKLAEKKLSADDLVFLQSGEKTLRLFGSIFGLFGGQVAKEDEGTLDGVVKLLIQLRQEARARKDYATGDNIRNQLTALGISLEDSPKGTHWKKILQ